MSRQQYYITMAMLRKEGACLPGRSLIAENLGIAPNSKKKILITKELFENADDRWSDPRSFVAWVVGTMVHNCGYRSAAGAKLNDIHSSLTGPTWLWHGSPGGRMTHRKATYLYRRLMKACDVYASREKS